MCPDEPSFLMAPRPGFEPGTCPLGGGRAIQLCHRGEELVLDWLQHICRASLSHLSCPRRTNYFVARFARLIALRSLSVFCALLLSFCFFLSLPLVMSLLRLSSEGKEQPPNPHCTPMERAVPQLRGLAQPSRECSAPVQRCSDQGYFSVLRQLSTSSRRMRRIFGFGVTDLTRSQSSSESLSCRTR